MKTAFRIAILVMAVVLLALPLCGCFAAVYEPTVKEGEFPFALEYELNGEKHLVEDTLIYTYQETIPTPPLTPGLFRWECTTASGEPSYVQVLAEFDEGTPSLFKEGRHVHSASVYADFNNADYYMGTIEGMEWSPTFYYKEIYLFDADTENYSSMLLTADELEEMFGIKILRLEYSEPIENELIKMD